MCLINANGTIEAINAAFTDIFGYKEEDIKGRNVSLIVPGEFFLCFVFFSYKSECFLFEFFIVS